MSCPVTPQSAARQACREVGLDAGSLAGLRDHATTVYSLPAAGLVIRVSRADALERLERSVELTRWLVAQDFPATEPADLPQPRAVDPYVVTFWKHYPQQDRPAPPPVELGGLLRALHRLPPPPVELPLYRPLAALQETVRASTRLPPDQRDWLLARSQELLSVYEETAFPLGPGHLHGDAYPGNTLWDGRRSRLGDWDEAAYGPREIDLASTFQGVRFGRTDQDLRAFSDAYGYDLRDGPGLPVLSDLRDLHTLGAYISRADRGDTAAAAELTHRITTLRSGQLTARWAAH